MHIRLIAAIILSYLLGSVPTAVIVGRILGVDVRRQGSCSPGATNLARLSGKRGWGALVLSIDGLKGFLPARFGFTVFSLFGPLAEGTDEWLLRVVLGSAAILGHVTSIFLAFHGGKGVATSLGVVLALSPWIGLACFVIWAILAELTRRISVSSLLAGLAFPILLMFQPKAQPEVHYFAWLLPIFLLFTHRRNLLRLARGNEPSIPREKLVRHLFAPKSHSDELDRQE